MTPLQKADFIEKIANVFNGKINRRLANLQHGKRAENEVLLREMIGNTPIDANKVVKIIYPRT